MICLYKSEDKRHSALLGGLLGIMTVFCYEMRPTALFIFIAALIFLPFVFKKKDLKYKTLAGIIFLLAACLTEAFIFYKKYRVFALISDNNFPVLYWLYMGSYGDGGISTNSEVFNTMLDILHNSDRNSILIREITGNYKDMGIAGTLSLWIRKTVTTWSDGYSDIGLRLGGGTQGSSIYEFLAGDHRELFYICCNAYRAASILGVLYSLKKDLISKKISSYRAVLTITLFGGLFFYMFWEAKSIYSASFLPVITILASEGFCDLERDTAKQKKPLQNVLVPLSALLLAFSCFMFISLAGSCREFKDMRIDSSNTNHEMSVIPWSGNGELTQTFTTEGSFNRIEIPVSHVWPPETVSSYTISISEAETGKELFDRVVTVPDNGSDEMITLSPGTIGKGSYILTVRKDDSSMTDIDLYTKEAYYFDSYEGELSYDGKTPVGDLTMNVSYCNTGKYLDIPATVILLLIYIGASALPVIYRR